ncbi:hypothetical protein BJV82DRAFT_608870 [Fennellomyces sp. T-0311]|nr:hypothetical protein BJV82DRAFT_608870 [Fennellomyces sp. T-0311]
MISSCSDAISKYPKLYMIIIDCPKEKKNRRKAQWYLTRDLAVAKDNEEHAIMLTFEAKGEGHSAGDYMVEDRENMCVVCASADGLTLHHVVPYVYRQWFPLSIKSKSSRDLLLLCKECHDQYERHATALKKSLATKYELPLEGKGWIRVPENRAARKAATALLHVADKIPSARQDELRSTINTFWEKKKQSEVDGDDWTKLEWEQVLKKCCELQDLFQGKDFIEHGQGVVQHLATNKSIDNDGKERWPDLEIFIKQWRQHFLDHSKPRYLSERWTVDGSIYTN